MAMVARMTHRFGACLLTTVLVACNPAPSTAPSAPGAATGAPASAVATSGAACVPAPGTAATPPGPQPAWADRTWYEVFVRSFSDSDGDGVGDLAGLTAKLDYLKDLGIGGVWLMPVAKAASYHGYDVTDYTTVEPDYGDEAALKAFIAAVHERDILVIADFVPNHTSIDHPWFQDALQGGPHRDWYIWSDTDPGWPAVAGPNPWHRTAAGDYYYGAFWEGMPDLNLRNPAVTAELGRIAEVWLADYGVDGFRIDAAKHLIEDDGAHQVDTPETLAWLADFTAKVHATHPDALLLGEAWGTSRSAGAYVPRSLDSTFDFGLAAAMVSAVAGRRTAPIKTALDETIKYWPANREASFLTNHDQPRVMSQVFGDVASARLAAFMLLTSPGVPFSYYGEEIGLQGRKPDEQIRTPMPWTADGPAAGFTTGTPWEPLAEDWPTANVATEAADPVSLLGTYKLAIKFRADHPALADGATLLVDGGGGPVIGWLRTTTQETLLVVMNLGATPVSEYALKLKDGPLCGTSAAAFAGAVGDPGTLTVAPPTINATGGFDAYQPLGTLQPRSGYVISLTAP
jgi:glycosidase